MNAPAHAAPIGTQLPHDYFCPGTSIMHGKLCFSAWAVAFWQGQEFRYERTNVGQPWIRTA